MKAEKLNAPFQSYNFHSAMKNRAPRLLILVTLLSLSLTGWRSFHASSPSPQGQEIRTWPRQTLRFENISLEDGLSQSSVMHILQDAQGFLWFGTEDGLNRYDGYTFKVFKPNPDDPYSLTDRWISALYESSDGSLWVGTRLGGLNRYDPKSGRFTHYMHDPNDPGSLASNDVRAIYEDEDGIIWVGTQAGLDWLDPVSGAITHIRGKASASGSLSDNQVTVLYGMDNGDVWIGTAEGGLNFYHRATGQFGRYPYRSSQSENGLCAPHVNAIAEDARDRLWIATTNGLTLFYPAAGYFLCYRYEASLPGSLSANLVHDVLVDSTGQLWAGTSRGLDRFDFDAETFIHYRHNPAFPDSLSTDTVYSIYQDRGGVLWIGTYGGGVNKHNKDQERFAYFRHDPDDSASLSNNFVFPIHVDYEGKVWVGTYGGGLNLFNPLNGTFTHYTNNPNQPSGLSSNYIWSLYRDREGNLWIGTNKGMERLKPATGEFTNYAKEPDNPDAPQPGSIYAILEDGQGILWVGTSRGLGRFDRASGLFTLETFRSPIAPTQEERISALIQDSDGSLWFGSQDNGLYRYDPATQELVRYRSDLEDPYSLSHDSVLVIFQDSRGRLWVGTGGGGLNLFEPQTESFRAYTEKDGLPNNVVYGILEDADGRLWLSTNHGISRFDPGTETFRNYSVSDGLGSMEFNQSAFAEASNGAMYFGSINGLNVFFPEDIRDNLYNPPVTLTSLTQLGSPLDTGQTPESLDEIVLTWPQNSFEFEFTALGFSNPAQNQYAYKLENFDKDWYELGSRRNGRYTNLPGGTYTLRLKAANSDGVWDEQGKSIRVTVVPPFWQTWWFRIGSALFIVASAAIGYRIRVRQIESHNRELEALVRKRTAEIEELFEQTKELAVIEERNRLARDLHDSAKQKAFAALAQLGTVNGMIKSNPPVWKHLNEAENLVYEVIQELTFLIQEMYPVALMEKGLPTTVREYLFEWENRNEILVELVMSGERPLDLKVEQAVYRVIQESLANVARHSRASQVVVSLQYSPNLLEVVIADNGCGFDITKRMSGLGLRSIRERVESVGGEVQFESGNGHGTRVSLHVPLQSYEISGGIHAQNDFHIDRR